MKRFLATALAAVLVAGLVACQRRDQLSAALESDTGDVQQEGDGAVGNPLPESQQERDPAAEGDMREVELAVRDCMAALKSGTPDNISRFVDYDEFLDIEQGQSDANLRALLERMEYEIVSADVDGDFASVQVKVSNIDMNEVLAGYLKESMDIEYNYALEGKTATDADYQRLFSDYLDENSSRRREETVEIAVGKIDGWWRVQPDAVMRAAVFGDYFAVSQSLGPNAGAGQ